MGLGQTTPRVLRFGVFELDQRSGELRKEGLRVRLQEQPLRILEALLDAPGEPVTREALRHRLWPDDMFVDFDSGLNRAINRLPEALITDLASWPALRVISRQSVMRYKGSAKPLPEIARELGVEGVVEGSVVRSAGRVRITAQLIHAPTDRHLWGHSYERRLEDVLALQDEVSRAIAEEVRITVTTDSAPRPARARAVNPEAYDAYLLGRHHWRQRSPQSLEKAIAYFQTAIAKDPGFAPAHEGLATTYGPRLIYSDIAPGRGQVEMKAAALKALELDPGLGEARAVLASALAYEWEIGR